MSPEDMFISLSDEEYEKVEVPSKEEILEAVGKFNEKMRKYKKGMNMDDTKNADWFHDLQVREAMEGQKKWQQQNSKDAALENLVKLSQEVGQLQEQISRLELELKTKKDLLIKLIHDFKSVPTVR